MSVFESGYSVRRPKLDKAISEMNMAEIKPMLCGKSHGDPCACIDCKTKCPFGNQAISLLDKETKSTSKPMNRKQIFDAEKKVTAMENYLEAMLSKDPVAFIKIKYNISVDRTAKNKIYQWQHNYGTNLTAVSRKIKEIKEEIAASGCKMNQPATEVNTAEFDNKSSDIPEEQKKPSKRQEEKISRKHLEQMREELENEYNKLEAEIETHKKAIEKCESRISSIVEETNAIRAVLDIFKKKDETHI